MAARVSTPERTPRTAMTNHRSNCALCLVVSWNLDLNGESIGAGAAEGIVLGGLPHPDRNHSWHPWELDTSGSILLLEDRA